MALIPNDPKQRNSLLIAILTVALGYLFWSMWYGPKRIEADELQAELDRLELNNELASIREVEGIDDLQERLALYERHVDQLERLIPEREEFVALLNDITVESRRQGVRLSGLSPEPEEVGAFYTKEVYGLELIGDYHDIGRFLGTIASLPRIVTPTDLDLQVFEGDSEVLGDEFEAPLVASLRIQTYLLPSGDQEPPVEGMANGGQEGGTKP
jgi:type IV pilus assembly protein PilO